MTAPASWEPIVGAIGPKLRGARAALGLSLQQLAVRADVSAAAIHKVERGDMVPTITTLLKLAAALDRPVTFFVDDAGAAQVARVVRAGERPGKPPGWVPAAHDTAAETSATPDERFRGGVVHAVIAPGGGSGDTRPLRAGEEVVVVTAGSLEIDIAGEALVLGPGDAVQYPTDRPHEWRNPGPAEARATWFTVRG